MGNDQEDAFAFRPFLRLYCRAFRLGVRPLLPIFPLVIPMVLSKFRAMSSKVSKSGVPMVELSTASIEMSGAISTATMVFELSMSEAEAVGVRAMQKSMAIERIAKMFFIKTVLKDLFVFGFDNGFYSEKTKSFGTLNETCFVVVLIGTGFPLESV